MISLFSIPKIIALFSTLYAVMIFTIFSFFNLTTNVTNIIKYTALFEIIIIIILLFGWRYIWKIIPVFNDWIFPDINGTWDVEIHWNWIQKNGTIKKGLKVGKVYIKQNFLTLSMELFTDESESETLVVQAKKNSESGRLHFHYIYRNTPKNNGINKLKAHIGTAILKVSPHENSALEGNYFTDRNTQGVLKFVRQKDNT